MDDWYSTAEDGKTITTSNWNNMISYIQNSLQSGATYGVISANTIACGEYIYHIGHPSQYLEFYTEPGSYGTYMRASGSADYCCILGGEEHGFDVVLNDGETRIYIEESSDADSAFEVYLNNYHSFIELTDNPDDNYFLVGISDETTYLELQDDGLDIAISGNYDSEMEFLNDEFTLLVNDPYISVEPNGLGMYTSTGGFAISDEFGACAALYEDNILYITKSGIALGGDLTYIWYSSNSGYFGINTRGPQTHLHISGSISSNQGLYTNFVSANSINTVNTTTITPTNTEPIKIAGTIWMSGSTTYTQPYMCTSNSGRWLKLDLTLV